MMDRSEEMKLGYQSAKEVLKKEKISNDTQKTAMVKKVGQRIANISGQKNFKWAFYLIDNDKQANAFCLPGGKVFVYTGLFKYIANDDELASVMGHEIGHAIARHGAERMSSGMVTQLGGAVLQSVMVGKGNPQNTAMVMQAFGVGTKLGVMLPHSREQENEADEIGVVLASKAGYNAKAALTFWQKFAKSGKTPPEYLSTHPAPTNRISNIRRIIKKRGL